MKIQQVLPLLIIFSICTTACTTTDKKKGGDHNLSDRELVIKNSSMAVEATVKQFTVAMEKRESSILAKLTCEELSYGHSTGKIQDKEQFIEDLVYGPFVFKTIKLEKQTITVKDSTAIVRHVFVADAMDNDTPVKVRIGNILVLVLSNGKWMLLARQAYKL
ncbi:protein of unknown function [Sinomicrobium oceani]|uniref:DUF4440 domain-containing protein n=1 Tax=Sinomicrobium oceani TaxID=1150368 RepID=A0A1K1QLB9_9FLAO|nr:nuclear transport factor 2 family protein [Sinomicrobium oceani]SFW60484.1 protein of unknown function [Sinomicrobium oceani]